MTPPRGTRARLLVQELVDAVLAPLARPARTLLVLLAYSLGVAALVGSIGVTQSTTANVVTRLTDAASTDVRVTESATAGQQPWSASDPGGQRSWAESVAKAQTLAQLEGVSAATPVRTFAPVSNTVARLSGVSQGSHFTGRLVVTQGSYFSLTSLNTASGDASDLDVPWAGRVVVLGAAAATSLQIPEATPGVTVMVNDRPITVAAILAPSGDSVLDNSLFFSAASMAVLRDQLDNFVLVRSIKGYAEPLSRSIPLALAPDNPGRISVSTVAELSNLQQGINTDLASLLAVIGTTILLLSALTAGTTMFLSVHHRIPEIALRRAMGASRTSIWRLFTYEGVLIGLSGGVLGTTAGILLAYATARANGWPLSLGARVELVGLAVGGIAGVAASMAPALYAARQHPASILRSV